MMVLELFGGLIYLLVAGDLLVRGSVAMSKKAQISPLVVGLTVVAFGTSAPELCISLGAVFHGAPTIAIGNVVGSNIANVLLVLGLPALIYPTLCEEESLGRDCGLVMAATLLFIALCFLGPLGRVQGAVMFALLLVTLTASVRRERGRPELEAAAEEELERVLGLPTRPRMIALFILLGALGLPLGAHLVVDGAVGIARVLEVSDAVVGLSVIAIGTSLPELATTLVAAVHRHSEVALGNVLGSNLFNLLAIMGVTAMLAPGPIPVPPEFLSFDLLVMLGVTMLLAWFAWARVPIGRGPGMAFLAGYALYLVMLFVAPAAVAASTSAPPGEGEVITYEKLNRVRPYLPAELWPHRELFFYEGMQILIGAPESDYTPAPAYQQATQRFQGQADLGPDGSLVGYTAGQPFPMQRIDCQGDPQAGVKVAWNFDHQWEGDGRRTHFHYSYWDRGQELPIYYVGTSKLIWLANRVEPRYLERNDGDLLPDEDRKTAYGLEVTEPFDSRGIQLLTYRYKSSEQPLAETRNDDTWVYVPTLRRVRRVSSAQRTDAVAGTDFTLDDLRGFNGIVPQYDWTCLGRFTLLAPTNTVRKGYPYQKGRRFGHNGLTFADDRWQLRRAVKVRMTPRNPDHPYRYKDLYLDEQTLVALYSFAYDRNGELWKIIWHNTRWSDDPEDPDYYPGWEGVPEPRDLKVIADIVVNVQTGTGNRIELWDADGTPYPNLGRVRSYIDVGRLSRGR